MTLVRNRSASGGVQSVAGVGVNNDDPLNPKIEQTPIPASIHRSKDNSLSTSVSGDAGVFIVASVDNLEPVSADFSGYFEQNAINEFSLKYTGASEPYKIDVSGSIVALSPAFLGTYIGVKVTSDIQGDFTGGVKFYPVGVSFGASPEIGFQITIYGQFPENEVVRLEVSSSTAGQLQVVDCIFVAEKIQPAV